MQLSIHHGLRVPTILIAILSFAAYAGGVVVVRRVRALRQSAAVHPFEVLLVSCALTAIVILRGSYHGTSYLPTCAVAMLAMGAIVAAMSRTTHQRVTAGTREFEDLSEQELQASLWKRWVNFSRAIGDYEFRLILAASYLLMIGPFAIAFRFLRAEPAAGGTASTWATRSDSPSFDAARRPF